jgi:hypothetical protein
MFLFAKIHQAFMCYKDNYRANLYWCPYLDLLKVVVLVPWALLKLHKFWLCEDDMNHYVGSMKCKYALDKLADWEIWPLKAETNLTQDEINF